MKTIYKYQLCGRFAIGAVTLAIHQSAEILSVAIQGDSAVVWAIVNPDRALETRRFQLVPTGAQLPRGCTPENFLGSIQFPGPLVLHVFQDTP